MRYMPCIVHSQAFLQIMSHACVMAFACSDITQNVNVVEMFGLDPLFAIDPEKQGSSAIIVG